MGTYRVAKAVNALYIGARVLVGCAVGGCGWACCRRPRVLVGCAVGGCGWTVCCIGGCWLSVL